MKYFLIALMLFNSLVSTVVSAQETYEVPVQKDEVEESKFKSDIEARLRRDIESYLGNNRFIIQVDALIERARTVVKEDAKPTQQRPQTNLPTAPKVSGNFQMPEINEGDLQGFEELPGLPVSELPLLKENQQKFRALQAQLKTLEQERKAIIDYADELKDVAQKQQASSNSSASGPTEKTISYRNIIKKLSITLVVDTQLKDEQIEFLRNLITRKAQINELRGDTLSIVKTGFSHLKEDKTPLTFWDEYSPWIWLLSLLFICLSLIHI